MSFSLVFSLLLIFNKLSFLFASWCMTCRYRSGWRPSSGSTELLFFRPLQLFMKTVVPYGSVSYLQFESFLLELLLLFQKSLSSLVHLFHFLPGRRVTYIIDADYFSMCFFSLSSTWNTPFFLPPRSGLLANHSKKNLFMFVSLLLCSISSTACSRELKHHFSSSSKCSLDISCEMYSLQ